MTRAVLAAGIGLSIMLTVGFLFSTNINAVVKFLTGELVMADRSELGKILYGLYMFLAAIVFFMMNWIASRKAMMSVSIFWGVASVLTLYSIFFQPSKAIAQWLLPLANVNGEFKFFSVIVMPVILALGHYGVALRVPESCAASLGNDVGEVAGDVF